MAMRSDIVAGAFLAISRSASFPITRKVARSRSRAAESRQAASSRSSASSLRLRSRAPLIRRNASVVGTALPLRVFQQRELFFSPVQAPFAFQLGLEMIAQLEQIAGVVGRILEHVVGKRAH
jgi:hypothetical protein